MAGCFWTPICHSEGVASTQTQHAVETKTTRHLETPCHAVSTLSIHERTRSTCRRATSARVRPASATGEEPPFSEYARFSLVSAPRNPTMSGAAFEMSGAAFQNWGRACSSSWVADRSRARSGTEGRGRNTSACMYSNGYRTVMAAAWAAQNRKRVNHVKLPC